MSDPPGIDELQDPVIYAKSLLAANEHAYVSLETLFMAQAIITQDDTIKAQLKTIMTLVTERNGLNDKINDSAHRAFLMTRDAMDRMTDAIKQLSDNFVRPLAQSNVTNSVLRKMIEKIQKDLEEAINSDGEGQPT